MKSNEKASTFGKKVKKMTLRGYYDSLPEASYPKKEFVKEVMRRTGMSDSAVRMWIKYGMRPANPQHRLVLSDMTGINEDDLWGA